MKILIAPDSFKESLKASEVCRLIAGSIREIRPDAECIEVPLADGGEGTVDALVKATGGKILQTRVKDPLMRDHNGFFGILGDGETAVIEMAAASGLEILGEKERNPLNTTTYGTGQLIKAALDEGCRKLIIGIGGSATNDGGAGMAQALGAKLTDKQGKSIGFGGGQLDQLEEITMVDLDPRLKDVEIIVASDVDNPLCGPEGASYVYGPQKGADKKMVDKLDKNLRHFGEILEKVTGLTIINMPGAGAAGGLGAGLVGFTGAQIKPGFGIIREITGLEEKIKNADLVVTGEGKLDEQTRYGKTPHGVATLAKKYDKPVIAFAGSLGRNYEELYDHGFDAIFSIVDKPMKLNEAIERAGELLKNASHAVFKTLFIESRN